MGRKRWEEEERLGRGGGGVRSRRRGEFFSLFLHSFFNSISPISLFLTSESKDRRRKSRVPGHADGSSRGGEGEELLLRLLLLLLLRLFFFSSRSKTEKKRINEEETCELNRDRRPGSLQRFEFVSICKRTVEISRAVSIPPQIEAD